MLPAVTRSLARLYGELDLPMTILTGDGDAIVSPGTQSEVVTAIRETDRASRRGDVS